ncbi:hypothetical protein ACQPZX_24955 [Actinoplanes sp. CA-142083]|uniref:hypothetical protein n=1 Tax=Actinoplanes sp. CA-142083 TaxID=3239903 RepID=UPI003D8A2B76
MTRPVPPVPDIDPHGGAGVAGDPNRPVPGPPGGARVDPSRPVLPMADLSPPRRSRIAGGLAALACLACCALPLLIAAGVLTGAGAALLQRTLVAVAAGLATLALGMWWLHRRRSTRRAAASAGCGCGGAGCGC